MLCLLAACAGIFFALRQFYRAAYPRKFTGYVEQYAQEYGVDPNYIYALIKTESNFRPAAVSKDDACGLMQLLPNTLSWLQTQTAEKDSYVREDLFDPEINVRYGVYLLSILFKKFENPATVAAAYHAGINGVERWLENPAYSSDGITLHTIPYADTKLYVERIMERYRIYQSLYR